MKSDILSAMISGIKSGFAQMAFIDVENLERIHQKIEYSTIIGIEIKAPLKGKMYFYFTKELKELLIENIYDDALTELSATKTDDCQLEMVNIIAGEFLSALYQGKNTYQLGLPCIYFDENCLELPDKNTIITNFDAEGAYFKVIYCNMSK